MCLSAIELPSQPPEDDPSALERLVLELMEELVDTFTKSVKGARPMPPDTCPCPIEGPSGALPEPRALDAIGGFKESEKTVCLAETERLGAEGKRCGDLLVALKERERMDDARAKEPPGEDLVEIGMELLEDLPAALDPACLSLQGPGDRGRRELLLPLQAGEDLELLPEGRAASGIVQLKPLEASRHATPGLHEDPCGLSVGRAEREVPLEAIDENEPARVFKHDQGMVGINCRHAGVTLEELKGDLPELHLPERAHSPGRSGSESTWNVG